MFEVYLNNVLRLCWHLGFVNTLLKSSHTWRSNIMFAANEIIFQTGEKG